MEKLTGIVSHCSKIDPSGEPIDPVLLTKCYNFGEVINKEVDNMIIKLNNKIKNLDMWNMACTKLSVIFFVLFLISLWPDFRNFILSVNPWILFLGWVIFAIRPLKSYFRNKIN